MFGRLLARRASLQQDSSLKDVLIHEPGVISFAGGLPDPEAFDMSRIEEITRRVSGHSDAWQYVETEGYPPLREAIARHMQQLGVPCDSEHILITQGSQQGLDLIAKLLIDPGDRILVEAPGYIGGLKAFENYEAQLVPVPCGTDGLDLDHLSSVPHGAKLLYTIPTFQNPTGSVLPLDKRRALLEIAADKGFLIVEDGAYHLLRYDGDEVPPIKSFDTDGRVVYLGSLSKVLVPGIRIGWIVAHPDLIQKLALLKQGTDLAGNSFGQLFAHRWLSEFGLHPPVDLYHRKRDATYQALTQKMPSNIRFDRVEGGFFFWLQLENQMDATALLLRAKAHGVSFVPGVAFGGPASTLRFSFSQVRPEDIDEGVSRLAAAIASMQQEQDFAS